MRRVIFILAMLAAPAFAQTPGEAARSAMAQLSAARSALDTADTRADRVAALTETVQAYEAGLAALRDGLRRAATRQSSLEAELETQSGEVARLLAVLQTIGRAPAPILLLHPSGPTGTARSAMMLAEVTPALQVEVTALREQLDEVAALRALKTDAVATLSAGLSGAQSARTALSGAISERTDLPRRFAEDPVQTAVLLASSQSLSDFASYLRETQENAGPDARTVKGDIPLPVSGQVIRQFNEADAAEIRRPGILIATAPRALVTTPVSATIRYAGPLLDYGNVIILEPAAETLWVIAGMASVFGAIGQIIPAGTPIGLMGGEISDAQAILNETGEASGGQRSETLYLEVRDRQSAVNPADWFAIP